VVAERFKHVAKTPWGAKYCPSLYTIKRIRKKSNYTIKSGLKQHLFWQLIFKKMKSTRRRAKCSSTSNTIKRRNRKCHEVPGQCTPQLMLLIDTKNAEIRKQKFRCALYYLNFKSTNTFLFMNYQIPLSQPLKTVK